MSYHKASSDKFLDQRFGATSVLPNGLNPLTVLEKPLRDRIINSHFFKEQCFGLNEADIVDRCVEHVSVIGGTYGTSQKPTPFICLIFKMLQLAPSDEILDMYMGYGGEKFKYLRCLGVFYWRLTRGGKECYHVLEEFLGDGRKIKMRGREGVRLSWVDQFCDDLLTKERVCGTSLWKLPKRDILEELEVLGPRVSKLGNVDELLEELDADEDDVMEDDADEVDEMEIDTTEEQIQRRISRNESRSGSRATDGSGSGVRSENERRGSPGDESGDEVFEDGKI